MTQFKKTKKTPEELGGEHASVQRRLRAEFYERQAEQQRKAREARAKPHTAKRQHKDM